MNNTYYINKKLAWRMAKNMILIALGIKRTADFVITRVGGGEQELLEFVATEEADGNIFDEPEFESVIRGA